MPALFFCSVFVQAQSFNDIQLSSLQKTSLASSPQWHALLHIKAGVPMIQDPQFLLSSHHFSPAEELTKTVALLQSQPNKAACRFPARMVWLAKALAISLNDDAFEHCRQLTEYLDHVPFNDISLVFASEVLSSASSMMGHVFLKASGMNYRDNKVEHALSFFTEYQTFNPVTIISDGLWRGMSGFFIVRPYGKERERYLIQEERNLFEYALKLEAGEKRLMQLHMWELKDRDINYLFQSYNCATLTLYVLGVARPEIKLSEALFVSPADVVKAAKTVNLINGANVNLSNEWSLSALELQLGSNKVSQLKALLTEDDRSAFTSTSLTTLEIEYLQRLVRLSDFSVGISSGVRQRIKALSVANSRMVLNSKVAKNPLTTIQDSIFSVALENTVRGQEMNFSFLPASHYLRTANSQFFSESELNIGQFDISYNVDNERFTLNQLTLYSFQSYVPTTDTLPRSSGRVFIGYKQHFRDGLEQAGFVTVEGGWGKSLRVGRDIIVYGLANIGGARRWSDGFWLAKASSGLIVNLAWQSKLRIKSDIQWTTQTDNSFKSFEFELSHQLSPHSGIFFNSKKVSIDGQHDWLSTIGIDWYF